MEVMPGASDGPSKLYCAGENALDAIPQDEMDLFAAKVGQRNALTPVHSICLSALIACLT